MAILNKIRQRSLFLILVIALALFSFVLADLFKNSSGFSSKSQNVVATVNDVDIERDDFLQKVENAQNRFRGSRTSTQVMNMVYDQEVRRAVLNGQYEKLGLSIERDKMRELLSRSLGTFEEFKNEAGLFDEGKLNEFIANLKEFPDEPATLGGSPINYQSWTSFEGDIAEGGKEQMYFNLVKAGIMSTLIEGELDYKAENDNVDIKYVQIPYSTIQDTTINVSNAEIEAYIKKNKAQFEVDATRDIVFVQFTEEASAEDEQNIQNELIKLVQGVEDNPTTPVDETVIGFKGDVANYEEYLAENSTMSLFDDFVFKSSLPAAYADDIYNLEVGAHFGPYKDANKYKVSKVIDERFLPDSVKVRHILIPFVGGASSGPEVTQTEEQAKVTADSILDVIKRSPSKFADLVTEFSSDKGSIENGGEYDYHPYNTMVPEFNEFEFNGKVGDKGVVKTVFGFHVMEILGQTEKQRAVKVAHLAKDIEASDATIDQVFNTTSKFEIAVGEKDFNEVATEKNYDAKPVTVKELDENVPGLGQQREMVRWAFEDETNVGDVRRFTVPNGGFVVAMVSAKSEKGLMDVDKAKATVLPQLRKDKKAQQIIADLKGSTLEEISTIQSQSIRNATALNLKNPSVAGGAGREPLVVGTAFGLKEGEMSKPIQGENGVYVIQVTKVTPAIELPSYQTNANRLSTTKRGAVNTSVFNALKEAADINDNRKAFY